METQAKNKNLSRLWNWGRLVLGLIGLILVVSSVSEDDSLLDTFLDANLGLVFIAFVLTVLSTIVKTIRWWLVVRHSHINVRFQRLLGTYLVGTFFSQFMPGSSMGGDAMRMVETSVDSGQTINSVSSILVERAIGLITIVVAASAILILSPYEELTGTTVWWVIHFLAVSGISGLIILRMGWFIGPITRILDRLRLGFIGDKIKKLSQALQGQLGETRLLAQMIILSFVANAATMTGAYIILRSLGESTPYLAFIPLIALAVTVELIPISPGALGLREATYTFFLHTYLDVSDTAALATALLVRGIGIVIGLAGGIIFLIRALETPSKPKPSTTPEVEKPL